MALNNGILNYGDRSAQLLSQRYGGAFTNRAAIKALPAKSRCDGMLVMSNDDGSLWRFRARGCPGHRRGGRALARPQRWLGSVDPA
jgi:hypothetical protein